PVARDERDHGAAVAAKDERLDDLAELAADGLRGVLRRRRAFRELLDAHLGAGLSQVGGHALDGLGPGSRRHDRNVPAQPVSKPARYSSMTPRSEIARNEAFFRAVNEGIAEASERFESEEAEFLCECGDDRCAHRIEVPLEDYERVRRH